jgi:hypothetical protein
LAVRAETAVVVLVVVRVALADPMLAPVAVEALPAWAVVVAAAVVVALVVVVDAAVAAAAAVVAAAVAEGGNES